MDNVDISHKAVSQITYTQEEAFRLLRLIREYLEEYFFSKPDLILSSFISSHTLSSRDKELLTILPSDFFTHFSRNSFYEILKDLRTQIEKDPIVTVYVPVGIAPDDTKKLALWFKENLDPAALMDLKIDDKLVGGISFVWKGIKHEYSFKMLFEKKKEEILDFLNNYKKINNI